MVSHNDAVLSCGKRYAFLVLCVWGLSGGCSTQPDMGHSPVRGLEGPPTSSWLSLGNWARRGSLGQPVSVSRDAAGAFEARTRLGRFRLYSGTRQASFNGVSIWLGYALRQSGTSDLTVNSLDLEKNLSPLLVGDGGGRQRQRTIVIDPGHGGENSGTRSVLDGTLEKHYTLDWALRLEPLLRQQGWRVVLTRRTDQTLDLPDRVQLAERAQADLFLSLHFNSVGRIGSQSGIETYCLTPRGLPSTLTRGYADDVSLRYPNNAFDDQNLQYAYLIHKSLLRATGSEDRGIRRARFMTVLRGQKCPAVLLEAGYLSNPAEAKRIAQPAYREALAKAVAEVLKPGRDYAASMAGASR